MMFRDGPQELPGGTPGAIRSELKTGKPTGGLFHLEKGAGMLRGLRDRLTSNTLTKGERTAAEAMYKALKDAFGKNNPEQFINNNAPPKPVPVPQPNAGPQ